MQLLVSRIIILLMFVVLVARLYQLQLVSAESDRYRYTTDVRTTRYVPLRPIRGEILASDGKTKLAETMPIYQVSLRPADLPTDPAERDRVFASVSDLLGLSNTLVISPTSALTDDAALVSDLRQGLGIDSAQIARNSGDDVFTMTVPEGLTGAAVRLSDVYSHTIGLENPIEGLVARSDVPGYRPLLVESNVPREVALVIRENAASLPGVLIEQDYERRYPLSPHIQSLSQVLGYIGRVSQCELVRQNPARSWITGLLDSIGNAVQCGIIRKQVNPFQLGMPRYLDDDRIGKDGIESSFESELRGQLGVETVIVDALGWPVRSPEVLQAPRDGNSLVLTLDVALQYQTETILRNWIAESERRRQIMPDSMSYKREYSPIISGVAIVSEVRTGRILAMVSLPSYDNNIWGPGRNNELAALLYPTDPEAQKAIRRAAPLTNRAIAGQYPPGSTIKQFDAVIALQRGVITPDTRVRDPGKLVVEDQFVKEQFYEYPNSSLRDNGYIDVSEALMRSSNVFFMSVAGGNKDQVVNLNPNEQNIPEGIGITGFAEGLRWFGFGERSGVKISGELPGRVPTPAWKQQVLRSAWTTGDTYNASIGQGNLEVTPLQLNNAAAAVTNGGFLFRPQIVRSIVDSSGNVVQSFEPELIRRIDIDPRHFRVAREGMRRSVVEGLNIAARAECSGLMIAGKTGTAEFGPVIAITSIDGRESRLVRQSHSWFVGFAPYDQPEIQVLVLVEGSGDLNDGSSTIAVPAATQIMQAHFGIRPPSPLPAGCQQGMPRLPARPDQVTLYEPLPVQQISAPGEPTPTPAVPAPAPNP
jgi:penicillin-binding protein 2